MNYPMSGIQSLLKIHSEMKYGYKINCKIVPIFFQLKPNEININNNIFTCNVIYIFVMYVDIIE